MKVVGKFKTKVLVELVQCKLTNTCIALSLAKSKLELVSEPVYKPSLFGLYKKLENPFSGECRRLARWHMIDLKRKKGNLERLLIKVKSLPVDSSVKLNQVELEFLFG